MEILGYSAGSSAATGMVAPTTGYTTVTPLTINGASRQPNAAALTFVCTVVSLDADDAETETVNIQVSPNNAVWDTIFPLYNNFAVSGLLGISGHSYIQSGASFWVPAGFYYRYTSAGTGASVVDSIREMTF